MNTVAPVWDGNETWLILGGGGLFAAFPLAHAIVMCSVTFHRHDAGTGLFEVCRLSIGGEIQTIDSGGIGASTLVRLSRPSCKASSWAPLFRHCCGWTQLRRRLVGLVDPVHSDVWFALASDSLLGSSWLVMKTDGDLREAAYRFSFKMAIVTLGFAALVS